MVNQTSQYKLYNALYMFYNIIILTRGEDMEENELRKTVLDLIIKHDIGINNAALEMKINKSTLMNWIYKNQNIKRYIRCKIEYWLDHRSNNL